MKQRIPITEWSTGLQLATDENHNVLKMCLMAWVVSKELGEKFKVL
jgi:hypothetical protein